MANPLRTCIGCTKTDDHPRHVVTQSDGTDITWHMDCHVLATGCTVCARQLEGSDGAAGDALREHLVSRQPEADVEEAS